MADSIARALSDAKVRNAKPGQKPVKLTDGGGLFLLVQPNGSKLWRYKFRLAGREGLLSIGAYPDVSLAAARELHQAAREKVAAGVNPVQARQVERREAAQVALRDERGTFAQALKSWQDATEPSLAKRTVEWRRWECDRHLIPEFGSRKIWEITRLEVADFLRRVERDAPSVAKIVRTFLVHIFERAIDEGLLEVSPVPSVRLLKRRRWVSHQAMEIDRFPAFMAKLMAADASPYTKGALLLIVLTACRKTEAAGARWAEFDLDRARWVIPPERMKKRREHFVPLSRQAVKLLRAIREYSGGGEFVFPHYYKPHEPMHHTTLGLLMRKVRDEADTVHGFRSMFSTYMNGKKENADVIELCLAHAPENVVRGIYNRYQYEDERRTLLQRWADDLDALVAKSLGSVPRLEVVKKQQRAIAA
jgi:integrase